MRRVQSFPEARWRVVLQLCIGEGCDRPPKVRGLCGKHYQRLRVRGSLDDFVKLCVECSGQFTTTRTRAVFCSQRCSNSHLDKNNPKRCAEVDCDRGVRAKGLCAMHWRRRARADGREVSRPWDELRKANYHKRRAQKVTTTVESIEPVDVYQRDMWICGLCSTAVDHELAWPHPLSPSLDHVQPLSKGGSHTWENLQLAHLSCNLSKGNRIAA